MKLKEFHVHDVGREISFKFGFIVGRVSCQLVKQDKSLKYWSCWRHIRKSRLYNTKNQFDTYYFVICI